jgi:hypothetical protein
VHARLEAVRATNLVLHRLDAGAHELDYAPALPAEQVVVPLPDVHVLVEVAAAAQLVLAHHAALDQQVEIAVHGGARSFDAVRLHRAQQRLGVEVAVLREDLVEQRGALASQSEAALPKMAEEALAFWVASHVRSTDPNRLRRPRRHVINSGANGKHHSRRCPRRQYDQQWSEW